MKIQKIISFASIAVIMGLAIWAVGQTPRWKVVASYRTGLKGRTAAQIHNVQLAARRLDGKILQPGAEFSFNHVVGSWSADRGYVKAPVSYDGELIPSWGGGVCQASTTLYNAVLLSGMDILERHRHRFPARYAPPGQDAAVAQYNIDLRFRNPYKWPLKIEAKVENGAVICRILSQEPLRRKVSVDREIRQIKAPAEVLATSETGSHTRHRVINKGAPGLRVAVFRSITVDGHTKRTMISEDTYPPMNRLVISD